MLLHKFRVVPLALGLFAVAALAAAPSHGTADVPRPAVGPVFVAAQPPAPKAKAAPVGIVVARGAAVVRFDPAGKQLGEYDPPKDVKFGGRAAVSPDGKWVAVAGMKDVALPPVRAGVVPDPFPLKLVVRRVDGEGETAEIDLPGFTLEPHWMPDSKAVMVAQATNPGRTAYRHVTVDLAAEKITPHGDADGLRILDVARDGKAFLCEQRDAEKKTAKLVVSLAGGAGVKELTDLKTPPGFIVGRFSPDGTRVLFTDGDPARKDAHKWGKSHRPYVLDIAGGKRAALADFPENGQALGVAWAPDGKRVAYTWTQTHADLLAKDVFTPEDAAREVEGFVIVADPDGRNAKTVASEKGTYIGHRPFGPVDWR